MEENGQGLIDQGLAGLEDELRGLDVEVAEVV